MSSNWMELGLTKDEEAFVRRGAQLYRVSYLDTIDNVFVIARSIQILHDRYHGTGVEGGFTEALVQYGFTARDGSAMNKAIRSHLAQLLANEAEVRAWWEKVPERTKRDWLSAKAIHRHWTNSKKPAAPPRKPSPVTAPKPAAAKAKPEIDRSELSMSAQQKLDAAIRQETKKLAASFYQAVNEKARLHMDEIMLPRFKEQIDRAQELFSRRRGLMDKATFNTIRRALHSDSRLSISDTNLNEAFNTFMGLEKYLLDEKDSPTEFKYPDGAELPRTMAEWDKRRAATTAERKANRTAPGRSAVKPR